MAKFKLLLPLVFTLGVVAFFYFTKLTFLKFYPPLANFSIFCVFFTSLFCRETIIQKFAKIIDGGPLNKRTLGYTKKLTYVWCAVLFLNFAISVFTMFLPDKFWVLYNGLVSYVFIGAVFVVEYVVRILFKKGLI